MTSMTADQANVVFLSPPRADEHRAFAALVRACEPDLRALANRLLVDRDRAEDVVQEAFLRAYRALPQFRGDSSVRTWLRRITTNLCLDEHRRRRPLDSLDDEGRPDAVALSPDPAELACARKDMAAAMATLPAELRTVVVLVDLKGLDYAEVSRVLGIPTGTVASRLNRAHQRLRLVLQSDRQAAAA